MERNLSTNQVNNLEDYLIKSGDELTSLMNDVPGQKIIEWEDGWCEYLVLTAYSKSRKNTKTMWEKLIKLAKDYKCDSIQCITSRNPKAFKRLFGFKVIETKLEYKL